MLTIPTTEERFDDYLNYLETELGQTAPVQDKAFLRVLASILARQDKAFYQYAIERTKQNLVLTATGTGLDTLGVESFIPRKQAVKAVMTATITTNVDVPALTTFIADSTKDLYRTTALASPSAGVATLNLESVLGGADYTLAIDDTLTIQSQIAGCTSTATVTAIVTNGLDRETDTAYRRRIQSAIRTVGGGGNNADYRTWAEAVDGVERAFPYSGVPTTSRIIDGDMEETGVTDWGTSGSPTLTKETGTPYEGLQCLRITRGASVGYATQSIFARYHKYNITGVARGDGTSNPTIYCGSNLLWTGTSSTSWQAFDITFTNEEDPTDNENVLLGCEGGSSSNYTEFDDVSIIEYELPGLITVYIECSTVLDVDGIPDQTLLDSVYDEILEDPTTGIHRPPLGILDEDISVEPISRTSVDLEIRGLSVPASVETQAKSEIEERVDEYLRQIVPFIEGLDSEYSNNSLLTDLTLSQYIQDILNVYGGSAEGIGISVDAGSFISSYQVGQGEMLKLGTISYV